MKIHEWKVQKGGERSVAHFMMLSQQSSEGNERKEEAIMVNTVEPLSKEDRANQY
jgi:hypothetical protein